ncbi:hypothetical protein OG21DRAFT_1516619 [Imleria badia]|nr:hypothetical protein OG21DRAFT_1516619 [Imleria badia]
MDGCYSSKLDVAGLCNHADRWSLMSTLRRTAPPTASSSSNLDPPSDSTQRRVKFERLRRKLGDKRSL